MTRRLAAIITALAAAIAVAGGLVTATRSQPATEQANWACVAYNGDPPFGVCVDSPWEDPMVKDALAEAKKVRDRLPV